MAARSERESVLRKKVRFRELFSNKNIDKLQDEQDHQQEYEESRLMSMSLASASVTAQDLSGGGGSVDLTSVQSRALLKKEVIASRGSIMKTATQRRRSTLALADGMMNRIGDEHNKAINNDVDINTIDNEDSNRRNCDIQPQEQSKGAEMMTLAEQQQQEEEAREVVVETVQRGRRWIEVATAGIQTLMSCRKLLTAEQQRLKTQKEQDWLSRSFK